MLVAFCLISTVRTFHIRVNNTVFHCIQLFYTCYSLIFNQLICIFFFCYRKDISAVVRDAQMSQVYWSKLGLEKRVQCIEHIITTMEKNWANHFEM